jgi:hypothetical protein
MHEVLRNINTQTHYKNTIFMYTALLGAYSYKTMNLYIREPNPYFLLFSGYFMYLLSLHV